WIDDPLRYLEGYYLSHDGKQVALTVRGRGFVAPVKPGRLVRVPQKPGTRHRDVRFLPGSGDVILMSDRSGEVEFWRHPANGAGESTQLTRRGRTLRHDGIPSPDG
ncbi:MAG: hypothetical protein GWO24_29235, partial [Akkermansiaceae bacterium]|nr:hypothetical protein [Akkermansiaceae bacterium]